MVKSIVLYQPKIVTINFSPQIIFRSFWSSLPEQYSPSSSRAKFSLPIVGYLAYKLIFWISFPSLSDSFYILQRRKISGTSVGQVAMQIGLPYVICYSDCMVVEQKKVSATVSTQQQQHTSLHHPVLSLRAFANHIKKIQGSRAEVRRIRPSGLLLVKPRTLFLAPFPLLPSIADYLLLRSPFLQSSNQFWDLGTLQHKCKSTVSSSTSS